MSVEDNTSNDSKYDDLSYMCMEFCDCVEYIHQTDNLKIDNFEALKKELDNVFRIYSSTMIHEKLMSIFNRVDLTTNELNKYTFWDAEKPYTRNLVATDNLHYTLLLLCWSPGKESKIHNHPCNGCYVKTVRGCIRECQYVGDSCSNITLTKTRFFNEGQISYINDSIGYHKIGNPFRDSGSVSLHLYTPPFQSCKVWVEGTDGGIWEDAKMGFFSIMGHRSPHLEGRPGLHSRLILEIRDYFKRSHGLFALSGVKRSSESQL